MMIQAPKHSVINAILLGRSGWRQNALATHLQNLLQKVTVFAEAHLGFFTSVFHHGAARGDTIPSHRLFHGFLEVCNCFEPAFVHLRLQITSQEKVRWGQSRGARTPLNEEHHPLPWHSDGPGSGPGAGFGLCCTLWRRATLLEPLGVQSVRRGAAAPMQATPKSPKDRVALIVAVCPLSPSAHMGQQMPWRANRAPTSSSRSSSCSGVAASMLLPCAVLCPTSGTFGCAHARPNGMCLICTK